MAPEDTDNAHWEGDINDAARDAWTEDSTAFDRITSTVDVTTEPQTAAEIGERAEVSEPTARKHLKSLAEVGRVERLESERGYRYMRSPQTIAMRRISAIHREHTEDEIVATIRDLETELNDLKETYEVESVEQLVTERNDEGRWHDVARWRQIEENLEIANSALHLYDFDPDGRRELANQPPEDADSANGSQSGGSGALGTGGSRQTA